jgi:SPP1 gp7 family putative phage head morphogenesis protein
MSLQRNRVENLKYARDRESRRLLWIHRQDRNINKQIADNMRYTMDSIIKEAKGWVATYAGKEGITMAEALKLAHEADIEALARKAKVYVRNKDFSPLANDEMRLYNFSMRMSRLDLLLRNMDLELISAFSENEDILSDHLLNMSITELERQAGILGLTIGTKADYRRIAETIANESFYTTTFSERIWQNQDQLKELLRQGLIKSNMMGQNPTKWMHELRGNLTEGFSGSTYALKRLVVTESARVQIASQKTTYEIGGYEWFEFIAEPTACEICLAFDGKVAPVKNMSMGGNAPPMHPNCKCSTAAHYSDEQYEKDMQELLGGE